MSATDAIVGRLLQQEPYKSTLLGYTLLTTENFNLLEKGMHIRYITLDEELKNGGTFLKAENKDKWGKCYLLIMSGALWKLKFQKNFIFFKEKQMDFRELMRKIAKGEIVINIKKNE